MCARLLPQNLNERREKWVNDTKKTFMMESVMIEYYLGVVVSLQDQIEEMMLHLSGDETLMALHEIKDGYEVAEIILDEAIRKKKGVQWVWKELEDNAIEFYGCDCLLQMEALHWIKELMWGDEQ